MHPITNAKTCALILKSMLNKKISYTLAIFHQNKYVTNFKKKSEFVYCFFTKQCSTINNSGDLAIPENWDLEPIAGP